MTSYFKSFQAGDIRIIGGKLDSRRLDFQSRLDFPPPEGLTSLPRVQRREGCGKKGDYLRLPYTYLVENRTDAARTLSALWIQYRYGTFADLRDKPDPLSRQFSQCQGRGAREVVFGHPDFQPAAPREPVKFSPPRVRLVSRSVPKLVILLDNSVDMTDQWDYVRSALKKAILHDLAADLEVGLVLFNEDTAHISHPVGRLGGGARPGIRNGLAFSIRNKHNLSPKAGGCIRCAVEKSIEALQTSGSSRDGVLILISRGAPRRVSGEAELGRLLSKHNLHLYPVLLPRPQESNLALERLAHLTAAQSFVIGAGVGQDQASSLHTYLRLVDALRNILQHAVPHSSQLVSTYIPSWVDFVNSFL